MTGMDAGNPVPNIRPAVRALRLAIANSVKGRVAASVAGLRHALASRHQAMPVANRIAIVGGAERFTPPLGYGGVEATLHTLACDLRDRGWEVHLWGRFQQERPELYAGMALHAQADPHAQELLRIQPEVAYFAWPTQLQLQRMAADRRRVVIGEFNAPGCLPPLVDGVYVRCFNALFAADAAAAGWPRERLLLHPLWQRGETRYQPEVAREDWLLWVGRPNPAKALEEAFRFSARTGETLHFYAPWYDSAQDAYCRLLRRLQPASAHYQGELPRARKADVFSRCKALLYTASAEWKEAFGLVFLEALASGTPVLALDHHPGSTQAAFFPGPPYGLRAADTDALAALWQTQGHLLRPDEVARRCAEIYDPDALATSFSNTLRQLAAEKRTAS